jgi:plastocyanin
MVLRPSTAGGVGVVVLAAALSAAACGSSSPTSPGGDATHVLPSTVMIESSGLNPSEITIRVGETVAFMNHETTPVSVAGGSDPSHPDCPEINTVGVLGPFDLRPTAQFAVAKTCDYHVLRGQAVLFNGRIVIR